MYSAAQVDKIIAEVKAGGGPLPEAAMTVAKACEGWPYVFGAWGALCTVSERKKRYKPEYPTIKTACKAYGGGSCEGCGWYPDGERVRCYDCRGFVKWLIEQIWGFSLTGQGATSQWKSKSNWKAKGTIDTIPEDVFVCLFIERDGKMSHTGVGYKGATAECSSGVQIFETRKKKRWTHWAVPACVVEDVPDPQPAPAGKPELKKGSKGEYVTLLQTMLINRGYRLPKYGADGSFGAETQAAVKQSSGTGA